MSNPESAATMEPECFLVSPFPLKRLASQEMSLVLWRHVVDRHRDDDNLRLDAAWFVLKTFESGTVIEIPSILSEMIDDCMWDPTAASISDWCQYHDDHIFFDSSLQSGILNCIDEFVLKPDGTINYLLTAKNIIKNGKLNAVEKYRFACANCLVDDVKSLWPLVRDDPRVMEYDSRETILIRYWTCVMEGGSPPLPGHNPKSFEGFVVDLQNMEWAAVEYFWETFTEDEQIAVAKKLLEVRRRNETAILYTFLFKLNKIQIRKLLEKVHVGEVIFETVLYTPWRVDEMYKIWKYMKWFISPSNFRGILNVLVKDGFISKNKREIAPLLFSIWFTASGELRKSIVNDMEAVEEIFRNLHQKSYESGKLEDYDLFMGFFEAVLWGLDFQSRNSLWLKFWPNIIVGTPISSLDFMMKICFDNDGEITEFKQIRMMNFDEMHDFCYLLIKNGHFSKLNEYLEFCSSNIHYVSTLKRQIIAAPLTLDAFFWQSSVEFNNFWRTHLDDGLSPRMRSMLLEREQRTAIGEKFVNFDKFVDSAFFDEGDARNFKKKLLMSSVALQGVYAESDKTLLGISWE
ncbi:uncharacterized protein MCU isoform X1 [Planococcus citri]|uniref:uncharacterized protein MCU isoform X1 n=1 Tax=Planococcus citri TaxID=170843 RepID=UPI0031FA0E44